MTLRAGELQARLTVTKTVLTDRPDGGQDETTVVVLENAGASVVPISADEQLRLGAQLATATYRARLWMPPDVAVQQQILAVTPDMQATVRHGYSGRVQAFEIRKAIDVDGRGRELELTLEARVT